MKKLNRLALLLLTCDKTGCFCGNFAVMVTRKQECCSVTFQTLKLYINIGSKFSLVFVNQCVRNTLFLLRTLSKRLFCHFIQKVLSLLFKALSLLLSHIVFKHLFCFYFDPNIIASEFVYLFTFSLYVKYQFLFLFRV